MIEATYRRKGFLGALWYRGIRVPHHQGGERHSSRRGQLQERGVHSNCKQQAQSTTGYEAQLLKHQLAPSDTCPPTKPYFLNLSKQCQQLGPNIQVPETIVMGWGGTSQSNHHNAFHVCITEQFLSHGSSTALLITKLTFICLQILQFLYAKYCVLAYLEYQSLKLSVKYVSPQIFITQL